MGASFRIVRVVRFAFKVGLGLVFMFGLWVVRKGSFMESFPVMGFNGMHE